MDLQIFGEQKMAVIVLDNTGNAEYYEKELVLENIGCNTVIKALEKGKSEISLRFQSKVMAEAELLEMVVTVESPFLKPVEEVILLKKNRDVSEIETVKKAIEHLGNRVRDVKMAKERTKGITFYGATL